MKKRFFEASDDDLISRREVEHMTSLSCSAIYSYVKNSKFPQPLKIGSRTIRWRRGDIKAWRDSLQPKCQTPDV